MLEWLVYLTTHRWMAQSSSAGGRGQHSCNTGRVDFNASKMLRWALASKEVDGLPWKSHGVWSSDRFCRLGFWICDLFLYPLLWNFHFCPFPFSGLEPIKFYMIKPTRAYWILHDKTSDFASAWAPLFLAMIVSRVGNHHWARQCPQLSQSCWGEMKADHQTLIDSLVALRRGVPR